MEEQYSGIPEGYSTPNTYHPETTQGISLIKELSPQDHLREQMAWLEGKLWDDQKKCYMPVTDSSIPFMNDEGRSMFFQFATSIISPIVTMSNYTKDYKMIHGLTLMLVKRAIIHFHLHYRDYGIVKKTQIGVLGDKLMVLGLSAFYKALGAGDRKAATSNIHENISTMSRPDNVDLDQNKQRSFMSRMINRR